MDKLVIFTFALLFGAVYGTTPTSPCSQTPYPDLCDSLIIKTRNPLGPTVDPNTLAFRDAALLVALNQAQQAHQLVKAMNLAPLGQRAKSAWDDCLDLYEDTVDQLNRSMSSTDPNSVQTWLSATITNQQTCQNGFIDFDLTSQLESFSSIASDCSKMLSNSLAINKAWGISASTKTTHGRRLLRHGFPEWVRAGDRKLLQSTGGAVKADLVVAQDGSGDYKTVSEAVKASTGGKRFVIHVKAGVYKENVEITKSTKNLMLIGDGIDATIITGSKNVQDGSTTFRSATFAVSGDGFMARDITFENTAGAAKHQAVAMRSGSDLSVFYRCSFKGYQDTLYVYSQRQFYRDCDIYGTQDFIFGNAAAVLQNCNIYVRKPLSGQKNTVTAQGRTDPNQNTGVVVQNSRVTAASDLKPVQGSVETYLGRPWQAYSRTVFIKTNLDSLIDPAGWYPWSGNFALNTLYYGEYMNTGPGAGTSGRVKWPGYHVITSATEAGKFTVGNFLAGSSWIPSTGVPFSSGL